MNVPVGRAALCLDCDRVQALPIFDTWRDRPTCETCGSRSLVPLTQFSLVPLAALEGKHA
jgi:hypothetical protein